MSLAESLERAAEALAADADGIRPANGDPDQLLELLDGLAATRVCGWLLANELEAADELAHAWLEQPAGVEALCRVAEAELPKPGRKLLRRVLHHARTRGLAVAPEHAGDGPKVARLPKLDEDLGVAYVSPHDPRGGRLVYVVESIPAGGARVFEALLDEQRGVVDFQVYRAGRRQVRDFVRDVTRRGRLAAVEAEPASVRELITRRSAAQSKERPWPRSFAEWRGRLSPGAEAAKTPGELARASLGEKASEAALTELAARVEARELGPWPPSGEALYDLRTRLREQAEAMRASGAGDDTLPLQKAADAGLWPLFTAGEAAEANAERFQESAYLFWRGGNEDIARACLATARALREAELEQPGAGKGTESEVVGALVGVVSSALVEDLRSSVLSASPSGVAEIDPAQEAGGDGAR